MGMAVDTELAPGEIAINEVFTTIQGEAHWTGCPSTFIRLQGCPVGCPWCDTKHTWSLLGRRERSQEEIRGKRSSAGTWGRWTVDEVVTEAAKLGMHHVVLTGGEPCLYDLRDLTYALNLRGHRVQIETSGTELVRVVPEAWVTVSPKIGMPGGRVVLQAALARANEIKMPVDGERDIDALIDLLVSMPERRAEVWLQPVSEKPENVALCAEVCMREGFRLSVQTHKVAGLR